MSLGRKEWQLLKGLLRFRDNLFQDPGRQGTLDVQFAHLMGEILYFNLPIFSMIAEVPRDEPAHAGIHHNHIEFRCQLADNGVVDDASFRVQECAVDPFGRNQRCSVLSHAGPEIPREAKLEQIETALSPEHHHRHVAGIEHPDAGEHREVLVLHPRWVPEGHFVTGKIGHAGSVG
ncbi:MAG: hypothetical protein A4E72_00391 [Syntrophus sp. PtaU1.Bin208]|nr:MAG: hypothetical protein A4E72_00391 [Syntrophus sp. PtaU1.Bin208]